MAKAMFSGPALSNYIDCLDHTCRRMAEVNIVCIPQRGSVGHMWQQRLYVVYLTHSVGQRSMSRPGWQKQSWNSAISSCLAFVDELTFIMRHVKSIYHIHPDSYSFFAVAQKQCPRKSALKSHWYYSYLGSVSIHQSGITLPLYVNKSSRTTGNRKAPNWPWQWSFV